MSIQDELVAKTYAQLSQPPKPTQTSRTSNTPNGYIFLIAWANAQLLRVMIVKFTASLPKSHYRLKHQIDDAARSVIANIEEGFARPTTAEYLTFLGYSQASLIEVKGDIQRCRQDNILPSRPGSGIQSIGINLKDWHEKLKASVISKPGIKGIYRNLKESKGNNPTQTSSPSSKVLQIPLNSFKFYYDPVDNLQIQDLTYEIFIELINKTDWHLRRLVESLEHKLETDRKGYQVDRLKIRSHAGF